MALTDQFRKTAFSVSCWLPGLNPQNPNKHPRWIHLIHDAYEYVVLRDQHSKMAHLLHDFLEEYADAFPSYKLDNDL